MWTHKTKFKGKQFKGKYEWDNDGERVFVLTCGKRKITFESWQMAKNLGWSNA